jgi:hypothetical protein
MTHTEGEGKKAQWRKLKPSSWLTRFQIEDLANQAQQAAHEAESNAQQAAAHASEATAAAIRAQMYSG